jgi:hypothetical protein
MQAQQNCKIGTVSLPGFGKGTIKFHLNTGHCRNIDLAEKSLGGTPWSHSMRTTGAYADFKNIEDGNSFHGMNNVRLLPALT